MIKQFVMLPWMLADKLIAWAWNRFEIRKMQIVRPLLAFNAAMSCANISHYSINAFLGVIFIVILWILCEFYGRSADINNSFMISLRSPLYVCWIWSGVFLRLFLFFDGSQGMEPPPTINFHGVDAALDYIAGFCAFALMPTQPPRRRKKASRISAKLAYAPSTGR